VLTDRGATALGTDRWSITRPGSGRRRPGVPNWGLRVRVATQTPVMDLDAWLNRYVELVLDQAVKVVEATA